MGQEKKEQFWENEERGRLLGLPVNKEEPIKRWNWF